MAQYESALSSSTLRRLYAQLAQMRATGKPITEADIRTAYSGAMDAEVSRSLQNRQLANQKEEFERQMALREQMYGDQQDANKMAGLATIAGLGMKAAPAIGKMTGITGGEDGGGGAQSTVTTAMPMLSKWKPAIGGGTSPTPESIPGGWGGASPSAPTAGWGENAGIGSMDVASDPFGGVDLVHELVGGLTGLDFGASLTEGLMGGATDWLSGGGGGDAITSGLMEEGTSWLGGGDFDWSSFT